MIKFNDILQEKILSIKRYNSEYNLDQVLQYFDYVIERLDMHIERHGGVITGRRFIFAKAQLYSIRKDCVDRLIKIDTAVDRIERLCKNLDKDGM